MTNPQVQNDPVYTLPVLNIYGLVISNDSSTPDEIINVSAGTCRDSNNIMDLTLGASNANLEGSTVAAPLSISNVLSGAGGLDTGSVAASKVYAVWLIGDSRYYNPVSGLLSLSLSSPVMPYGYDSKRLIGYAVTDSSSDFLLMYCSGTGSARQLTYDAWQATAITAGADTNYTAISLAALVPAVDQTPVAIAYNLSANAAADTLKMQGANSTGDAVIITAQAAAGTAHLTGISQVLSQNVSSVPKINYKVSSGSAAVAIDVAGFTFYV